MNNPTTFYIIRHGESEGNASFEKSQVMEPKIPGGSSLTEKGRAQATQAAEKLRDVHFDEMFSSPLNRAIETAEILAAEKKLAIQTKENLKERVRGTLNGQSEAELRKTVSHVFGNAEQLTDEEMWQWRMFDDMETAEEAVSRCLTELREIAVAYPGKIIGIVSHGNIMRGLLVHFGLGTFRDFQTGTVKNTGYIKLESDGVDFVVKETYLVEKKEKGTEE